MSDNLKGTKIPTGRIQRFSKLARVGGTIAGRSALKGAGQLFNGQPINRRALFITPQNMRTLTEELARMRGAAMKVGQMMSMDTGDMFPPEVTAILERLRNDAHFMPPKQLKQVLDKNWGPHWKNRFAKFEPRPIAAASIGQVHRATLKDGTQVALKIQYPGVRDSIDSDIKNVGQLLKLSGLFPQGFDLSPYLSEATTQLHKETDYLAEGAALTQFGMLVEGNPDLIVPQWHEALSTDQILAMSYIPNLPIESAAHHKPEARNAIVRKLLDLFLSEIFDWHFIQSDPNFANYRLHAETGQIVLLDFGAAMTLKADLVESYRHLLRARTPDTQSFAAKNIGFIDDQTPDEQERIILEMIAIVLSELHKEAPFDFSDRSKLRKVEQMGEELVKKGATPPQVPMQALYIQRKLAGLYLLGNKLEARVDLKHQMQKI